MRNPVTANPETELHDGEVTGGLGWGRAPAEMRAHSSIPSVDYVDTYTVRTGVRANAETWARTMFGDCASRPERFIWQGLLGLQVAREPSPDLVAGWRVSGRSQDWICLETGSVNFTFNLLVAVVDQEVSLLTISGYRRRRGELVWTVLSAVHRFLAPGVLRGAAAKLGAAGPGQP